MDAIAKLQAIALDRGWPEVETGLSWGTPGLLVRKKMLVRVKEIGVIVLTCSFEMKEHLLKEHPEAFFQTPHYEGYPALLVRLATVDSQLLGDLMEMAWRKLASKKALKAFDLQSK
jgi:hypothetical protein